MRLEVGIIAIMEQVLGMPAERRAQFEWLRNKPQPEHFADAYADIRALYAELEGDWEGTTAKTDGYLIPDAYFPEPYHFIFEFDELQHFTRYRERTLRFYPPDMPLAYEVETYRQFCRRHHTEALAKGPARFRRATADFPYANGRAAQRAFFDTFRDWLPPLHGLNPTVRLAEFEVRPILNGELTADAAKEYMEKILRKKLGLPYPLAARGAPNRNDRINQIT